MQDYDITNALIARISAQCPGFATVDEAWFSEPVDDYSAETPAAYPYLAEDAGEGVNELSQRQAATQVYGVFIICESGDVFRARQQRGDVVSHGANGRDTRALRLVAGILEAHHT